MLMSLVLLFVSAPAWSSDPPPDDTHDLEEAILDEGAFDDITDVCTLLYANPELPELPTEEQIAAMSCGQIRGLIHLTDDWIEALQDTMDALGCNGSSSSGGGALPPPEVEGQCGGPAGPTTPMPTIDPACETAQNSLDSLGKVQSWLFSQAWKNGCDIPLPR